MYPEAISVYVRLQHVTLHIEDKYHIGQSGGEMENERLRNREDEFETTTHSFFKLPFFIPSFLTFWHCKHFGNTFS